MEQEFHDFDSRNAWNRVYQEIRNESNNFEYTYKEARKQENKNLNRYRDVNPFDHSRVHLKRGGKDYINASIVKVTNANRSYILTQGPLPATTGHFWLMIWEQKSKAILMLNRVIEKNTVKCHLYWPTGNENGDGEDLILNDVGLAVSYLGIRQTANYSVRRFLLTDFQSGKSEEVLQFHYTTWPDFGVPESPAAFLSFLFDVRASGVLSDNVGPAVVHCSAGIGRSGTFCLVDSCLVLVEKQGDASAIDIRKLLLEMRRYRMGLIQTPDQLRFSYLAIIEGSKLVLHNDALNNSVPFGETEEEAHNTGQGDLDSLDLAQRKLSVDSEGNSEGSDNANANVSSTCDSTLSTPPPLPPRPVKNQDVAPCNSVTVPSLKDEIVENSHIRKSILHPDSDQNQNRPYETNSEINTSTIELAKSNQKTELSGSDLIGATAASASSLNDSESLAELRKRKRKERSEKTASIVQKIKKKQKETEIWQKRRSFLKRISVGLAIVMGAGFLAYRYYYKKG